jgi:hypothetical protein
MAFRCKPIRTPMNALAQQTRTFAEATSDHGSRRVMQDLATGYETLANADRGAYGVAQSPQAALLMAA